MKTRKFPRGFTLIELLVVVAIIGLLASVVLASLGGSRDEARHARTRQEVRQIEQAALMYELANGSPAPDVGRDVAPAFVPEYLPEWPTPPCGGFYDWNNHELNNDGQRDVGVNIGYSFEADNRLGVCFTETCYYYDGRKLYEMENKSCQ